MSAGHQWGLWYLYKKIKIKIKKNTSCEHADFQRNSSAARFWEYILELSD